MAWLFCFYLDFKWAFFEILVLFKLYFESFGVLLVILSFCLDYFWPFFCLDPAVVHGDILQIQKNIISVLLLFHSKVELNDINAEEFLGELID